MLTRARPGIVLGVIVLVAVLLAPLSARGETAPTAASAAKIAQLSKASSRQFVRKTDTVWYTEARGKSLKNFKVVVAIEGDLAVTFVTVATKANLKVTAEFMHKLLRFNHSMDFVKVGLDNDGDIFVRYDSSIRLLDDAEYEAVMKQVSAAADEVHKGVGDFLIAR